MKWILRSFVGRLGRYDYILNKRVTEELILLLFILLSTGSKKLMITNNQFPPLNVPDIYIPTQVIVIEIAMWRDTLSGGVESRLFEINMV